MRDCCRCKASPEMAAAAKILKNAISNGDVTSEETLSRCEDSVQRGFKAIRRARDRRVASWKATAGITLLKASGNYFEQIAKASGTDEDRRFLFVKKAEVARSAAGRIVARHRKRIASRNTKSADRELGIGSANRRIRHG